ncbi:type VII secretion integral membrane protein EccD [Protaetiibacter intestinalis]|uniref:Type VII secretion integral membrane protein EccD n=1 Tax=Protaetiibacter intestinalis TaxID=2419774 RepID=A0A387B2G2_9MICO|nr:type VII secretion integral membrane protein EccD [Protaetiibacter intestinalis]AYF97734.1 type VII secretion integral membrane protein EccD [Protaetiibacter intestinalis]
MSTPAAVTSVIRVSVASEGRRLDVGIPSQVAIIELLPGFARSLGVLDPSLTHGGYALQRTDGSALDPAKTCGEQGVRDGDVLTLLRGVHLVQPKVYDDVVETVIDATSSQNHPWTPRDHARTALAVSLCLVALAALVLVLSGPGALGWMIAAGSAVVLTVTGIVLGRLGQPDAAAGIGLAAAALAGVAGFLYGLGLTEELWSWPLMFAGIAAVVVGMASFALSLPRDPHLVPIVAGVAVAIPAVFVATMGADALLPVVVLVAVAGSCAGLIPWLALSTVRIKVISPQSDQEIFATPAPIDSAAIAAQVGSGRRIAVAIRIGLALAVVLATPLVAASGTWGAALMAAAFAAMMFPSRQTYARVGVFVIMAIGVVGLVLTGITVAVSQPELHAALLVILFAATAVIVALTLLAPRARPAVTRIADIAEVLVVASLLPLGVITAGLN